MAPVLLAITLALLFSPSITFAETHIPLMRRPRHKFDRNREAEKMRAKYGFTSPPTRFTSSRKRASVGGISVEDQVLSTM